MYLSQSILRMNFCAIPCISSRNQLVSRILNNNNKNNKTEWLHRCVATPSKSWLASVYVKVQEYKSFIKFYILVLELYLPQNFHRSHAGLQIDRYFPKLINSQLGHPKTYKLLKKKIKLRPATKPILSCYLHRRS